MIVRLTTVGGHPLLLNVLWISGAVPHNKVKDAILVMVGDHPDSYYEVRETLEQVEAAIQAALERM